MNPPLDFIDVNQLDIYVQWRVETFSDFLFFYRAISTLHLVVY